MVDSTKQISTSRIEGLSDVRWEPLYDTYKIATGSATAFTNRFFSTQIGGTKTEKDTNMQLAASLPKPHIFRCFGIKFECITYHKTDIMLLPKLMETAYLRFFIGTKDYLTVPMAKASGGITMHVAGGKTDGADEIHFEQSGTSSSDGYKFPKNGYIDIGNSENFGVELVSASTHGNAAADMYIRCYLLGYRALEVR